MFLLYLGYAIFSGYTGSLLGIGAGVLLMPFFTLIGLPYQTAVEASLSAVLLSSITGGIQSYQKDSIIGYACFIMAVPAAVFALFSNLYLINFISPQILMMIYACLMFINVDLLRYSAHRNLKKSSMGNVRKKRYLFRYLSIGSVTGLLAGLLGIGGGIVIVPMLVGLASYDVKVAVRHAIIIMIVSSFFALLPKFHQLPYGIAIPASLGAIIGAYFGIKTIKYVKNEAISRISYFISFSLGATVLFKVFTSY